MIIGCSNRPQLMRSPESQFPSQTSTLNIWWEKGFNLEEDEAFQKLVKNWSSKTGHQVKLSFYTTNELLEKTARASQMLESPDLVLSQTGNLTLYPRLAWEGKLADVSELIEPVKSLYDENAIKAITYYNQVESKESYYGIPIYQATIQIFYWQKLLAALGYSQQDIPQNWDDFWQFWLQVQNQSKKQLQKNIYALGFPLSVASSDTYLLFEHLLEAYNLTLVDREGNLLVDQPEIRQGIIQCLEWYSKLYQQSYIPPDAINWLNTDNNRNLLNRVVVMTPNVTLSIPAAVRQDNDIYYNQLGILEFPKKPNGQPMRYLLSIKQAVILRDSTHSNLAKEFLRYLIEPNILAEYIKASGIRNVPVQKPLWQDPFWQNSQDPYLTTTTKILTKCPTRLFYTERNPAYSVVLKNNVWGKALTKIVIDRITPEQAADNAIAEIKQIFANWN
ncbi:ABC transporter substrate-binding protein [Stanieria cyanosphaera]|nr:ABC transporter substrate-binding protein [Stanieria cyanosphaera]